LVRRKLEKFTSDECNRFGLAAALQGETERRIRAFMAPYLRNATDVDICLSGGVFLNCLAAGKVARWFPQIRRVFMPPAPYDGGLAMGLAQAYLWDREIDPLASEGSHVPFAGGRDHSLLSIHAACRSAAVAPPTAVTARDIAERIGRGEIIALFQGGSEAGRRALGNRSIVADPRDAAIKEVLNDIVKKRQ